MGVWCTIPVSVGIAITRYHLYEIDRIVSRTVSYTLVGLILGAVYAVLVVVVGAALGPQSDLTVAAATLAAAAIFSPVRRRIQHAADRRFNRPSYHAQQELEAFAQHLRGQTRLTTVSDDLIRVVDRTLQPSSAALWIRNT
jgi:sulfite exporter TauE/SafE